MVPMDCPAGPGHQIITIDRKDNPVLECPYNRIFQMIMSGKSLCIKKPPVGKIPTKTIRCIACKRLHPLWNEERKIVFCLGFLWDHSILDIGVKLVGCERH